MSKPVLFVDERTGPGRAAAALLDNAGIDYITIPTVGGLPRLVVGRASYVDVSEIDQFVNIASSVGKASIPNEIKCLDHGYVALVEVMGDDRTPARCARTSFRNAGAERSEEQDAKLTDYLVRNKHTTPIEFCQVRFYMKMPIFVARQLVRHRTASINEVSYRYVQAAREFYVPAPDRMQRKSESNKQGSSTEIVDDPALCAGLIINAGNRAFDAYGELLKHGLAPELARVVLPCGTYTEWYWQNDLHNTLHMLRLRLHPHAQYEIRVYAEAMLALLRPIFPTIIESWERTR